MADIMIDLETLGTKPNCVVLSIGMVKFSKDEGLGKELYLVFDIDDQVSRRRKIEADTLKWWMDNTDDAKKVFKEDPIAVDDALDMITEFVKENGPFVWGNGAIFDISILENLYIHYQKDIPWKFWEVMDLRTFKRFNGINIKEKRDGTYHNALDDARTQAKFVIDSMRAKR